MFSIISHLKMEVQTIMRCNIPTQIVKIFKYQILLRMWTNRNIHHCWWDYKSIPFSRGSSQPRDGTQVSLIAGGFFTS